MRTALFLLPAASLLAAGGLIEGNPASAVRVIIYEDLQCSDCADFRKMLDEKLLPKYKDKVAFEHRDFPLAKHAWARKAAIAARFIQEIDPAKAIAFRQYLMANQPSIQAAAFEATLAQWARDHGIDGAKAVASLSDARLAALVEKDYQEGVARGIARTPTVLVDGEPFIETFPVEDIMKSLDRALAP